MSKEKEETIGQYVDKIAARLAKDEINVPEHYRQEIIKMFADKDMSLFRIKREIDKKTIQYVKNYQFRYEINDLFYCTADKGTMLLHVKPTDLRGAIHEAGGPFSYLDVADEKLEEALNKLPDILKTPRHKSVKTVGVYSHLISIPMTQDLFSKKGFKVGLSEDPALLDYFKKKFGANSVGYATMPKAEFLKSREAAKRNIER